MSKLLFLNNKIVTSLFLTVCLSLFSNIAFAKSIMLEGLDGKQHAVDKYIGKGKWTVLNLWGTNCPPCREEMPDLVQFHDTHKDTNAIVVGIAIDFPSYGYAKKEAVIAFADDFLIDFPLLLSDSYVTEKLGLGRLEGLPTTQLYNSSGKLVAKQVGGITKTIIENFIENYTE